MNPTTFEPLPEALRERLEAFHGAPLADVRLVRGALAVAVTRIARAWAVTLGPFIFLAEGEEDEALVAHETTHVLQFRELGLLRFLVRYLSEWRAAGHCYEAIALERAAFAEEDRFLREAQTERGDERLAAAHEGREQPVETRRRA